MLFKIRNINFMMMKELFELSTGANFTVCRIPVEANDFSYKWYSYNETLKYSPSLEIRASLWSPLTWMKYNIVPILKSNSFNTIVINNN
jgi:glucosylceramidase